MKTSFLFFVVSLQKLSWFMSLSDYICLINALFDGGVCALVFFSLWESMFCIVRLRSVSSACACELRFGCVVWLRECSWSRRYACLFNYIKAAWETRMRMCVTSSVLSGCVPLLDSFICTTPGILTVSFMPMHGPVRQQVCAGVSVCAHVSRFVWSSAKAWPEMLHNALF